MWQFSFVVLPSIELKNVKMCLSQELSTVFISRWTSNLYLRVVRWFCLAVLPQTQLLHRRPWLQKRPWMRLNIQKIEPNDTIQMHIVDVYHWSLESLEHTAIWVIGNVLKLEDVTRAIVGHTVDLVWQLVNGAIQPNHFHEVFNTSNVKVIPNVICVGNVLDHAIYTNQLELSSPVSNIKISCNSINFTKHLVVL